MHAFGLALPLLAFILVLFVYPIANFLTQAFYDARFATLMPGTTEVFKDWDAVSAPTEEMALYLLLIWSCRKKKRPLVKWQRVNRECQERAVCSPNRPLCQENGSPHMEAPIKKDKDWGDIEVWQAMKRRPAYTPAYLAAAVDLKMLADGSIVRQDEDRRST